MMFDIFIHKWLRVPYLLHAHTIKKVKKPKATLLLIHGIGSSGAMWQPVISHMPSNVTIIAIDLLGFGNSPNPSWATYDAKTQAAAVVRTLKRMRVRKRPVIVGHSLGALVAVEIAANYPHMAKSLVLCSPPFYKNIADRKRGIFNNDRMLNELYDLIRRNPKRFLQITKMAKKLGVVNEVVGVSADTIGPYISTIEASIINQSALRDAEALRLPIRIIHGKLDPVVVPANLKTLTAHDNVQLTTVMARHGLTGKRYTAGVTREILASINQ